MSFNFKITKSVGNQGQDISSLKKPERRGEQKDDTEDVADVFEKLLSARGKGSAGPQDREGSADQWKVRQHGSLPETERKPLTGKEGRDIEFRDTASDMSRVLEGRDRRKSSEDTTQQTTKTEVSDDAYSNLGTTILRNMFSETTGAAPQNIKETTAGQDLVKIANEIAEYILVSRETAADNREVRIMLKDSVLPQTELRVSQGKDGTLQIEFYTASQEARELLLANRESLQNHLNNRLQVRDINIEIRTSGGEADTEGRSRGQRNLYEEMEE